LEPPAILLLWGGQDVHPALYARPNIASYCIDVISDRDKTEAGLIEQAIRKNIPIIGVCRGSQLSCVAAGGTLIQHVDGHTAHHTIVDKDGVTHLVTSTHHQLMYPWDVPHEVLAWAHPSLSKEYIGVTQEEMLKVPLHGELYMEPEVVWFPQIRALAVQPHPEDMETTSSFHSWLRKRVHDYILS